MHGAALCRPIGRCRISPVAAGGWRRRERRTPDGTSALVVAAHSGHGAVGVHAARQGRRPECCSGSATPRCMPPYCGATVELVKALLARQVRSERTDDEGHTGRRNSQDFELPETCDRRDAVSCSPRSSSRRTIMRALAAAGADTRLSDEGRRDAALMAAVSAWASIAPAQDEKRGTDRRGLAILDGGKVEPTSSGARGGHSSRSTWAGDVEAVNPAGETAVHIAVSAGVQTTVVQRAGRPGRRSQRAQRSAARRRSRRWRSAGHDRHGRSAPQTRRRYVRAFGQSPFSPTMLSSSTRTTVCVWHIGNSLASARHSAPRGEGRDDVA